MSIWKVQHIRSKEVQIRKLRSILKASTLQQSMVLVEDNGEVTVSDATIFDAKLCNRSFDVDITPNVPLKIHLKGKTYQPIKRHW